jgi:hypothetical protein
MELANIAPDVFLGVISEELELSLVRTDDRAVAAGDMKGKPGVLEEVF